VPFYLPVSHRGYVNLSFAQVRYAGTRRMACFEGCATPAGTPCCRTFPQAPAAHRLAFGSSPHFTPKRALLGSHSSRSPTRSECVYSATPPNPWVSVYVCHQQGKERRDNSVRRGWRLVDARVCACARLRLYPNPLRTQRLLRLCCARAVLSTRSSFNSPTLYITEPPLASSDACRLALARRLPRSPVHLLYHRQHAAHPADGYCVTQAVSASAQTVSAFAQAVSSSAQITPSTQTITRASQTITPAS